MEVCDIMEKINQDEVAIIILNWNAYDDTFECLKSLEKLQHVSYHVFLVDNNSKDYSFNRLKEDYFSNKFNLTITFIQTGANLGFAGGNNVAIKIAFDKEYKYYWLLNNDAVVEENSLYHLIDKLKCNPEIGIVGSKIIQYGSDIIEYAGAKVNLYTGTPRMLGQGELLNNALFNESKKVDFVSGCSLAFRKELLEQVGYMNEDYFMYYEETEWCLRSAKMGWKVIFEPKSVVHHKGFSSSGGRLNPSPSIEYYDMRNAFIMIKRTQSKMNCIFAFIYMFPKSIKKIIKIYIRNYSQKRYRFSLIYKGMYDAFRGRLGGL